MQSPGARVVALPPARRSLAMWAAFAAVAVLFSYTLALAMAVACIYLPYLALDAEGFNLQLVVLFAAGAVMSFTIVWSILPRRDRFQPPGPLLDRASQPRLFMELEQIAAVLKEPMPGEVYLIPDANAFVAQRGGILGFGSRRVMGLGLPLIPILTVVQFRAVLAHEFGHYYAGDTRLGAFVYRTRDGIARSLRNLSSNSGPMAIFGRLGIARLAQALVVMTLGAYWKLFMRLTQLVSRRQEYRADELACALTGPDALVEGLQQVERAVAALGSYWQMEVLPVLSAGYRPPVAEGFTRFLAAPVVTKRVAEHLTKVLDSAATGPLDTHPPLRDRIAAARKLTAYGDAGEGGSPAISLLDGVDQLELRLLERVVNGVKVPDLKPVPWEHILSRVWIPAWRSIVVEYRDLLTGITAAALPEALGDLGRIVRGMRDPKGRLLDHRQRADRAASLLWMALTVALLDQGWQVQAGPGEFRISRDGVGFNPSDTVARLRAGTLKGEDWVAFCRKLGIAELAPGGAPAAGLS